jgi:AAA domain
MAVSVSSATACVDSEGKLKIDDECLEILARADEIFLTLDQDPAGQKCADAFEINPAFNSNQIKRIQWPYKGKRSDDPKDIGDLYKADQEGFLDKLQTFSHEARVRPPKWRQAFRTIDEMDGAPIKQLIEGFMTEGNIGIGGLSGSGKTFLALSIVKALTTGRSFVGHFKVPEIVPVIYLIPEVGDRQFAMRAKAFGIPTNDDAIFMCRTLSQGVTLPLDNPWLVSAIRNMGNPVVVLDTAIRFSKSKDENSAKENLWMEQAMRSLREAGCIAVIALHHSIKKNAYAKDFYPSLENTFRGTGDIGALLDIGYSIHRDKKAEGQQVIVSCVKPRDFDPPAPFHLGLRYLPSDSKTGKMHSYIQETGDLVLMSAVTMEDASEIATAAAEVEDGASVRDSEKGKRFVQIVTEYPKTSWRDLRQSLHMSQRAVDELATSLGYEQRDGVWADTEDESGEGEIISRDFAIR